ncbi:MAG: serine/threonine protein kinase [Clostridia bacterium]|nr:serine/threonine protein kinase [Clostridia bacterium]
MATIGQVIDDKYEVLKLIGQGGMSKVYLAMDKRLNKQWAIKEIEKKAKDKNNEVVIQSAIAEANMIKQLDHPSIVRIVDIIDNGNVIYIIEDYIEGEPLATILENEGAQSQDLVISWAKQLCEALDYLHTRTPPIIYRDMKPANVMLKPDGSIKVIDFGIAREYKDHRAEDTVSLGTKGYAAPEQFGGKGQTDARTDIYCLGVTLYHLVTGQNPCEPPYQIYPIRHWNPQLSSGLELIIQKCTQLNPADRYQSCAELLYALNHYEEYTTAYRAKQKKKFNLFIATIAAAVGLSLLGSFSMAMKSATDNSDYDKKIIDAETAVDVGEKLNLYEVAVNIKPYDSKAYLSMIEYFKSDGVFDKNERDLFSGISKHLKTETAMKENPDYGEIVFEAGKLYWYYSDGGAENNLGQEQDNTSVRKKDSTDWFKKVIEYDEFIQQNNIKRPVSYNLVMAEIYKEIGYYTNKIINGKEGMTKEEFKAFWTAIEKMVDAIYNAEQREDEIVELEAYYTAITQIESYANKFKAVGVSKEELTKVIDTVQEGLKEIDPVFERAIKMKEEVEMRIQGARLSVEAAFAKEGR